MILRLAVAGFTLLLLSFALPLPAVFATEPGSEAVKQELQRFLDELLGPPTTPAGATAQSDAQQSHPRAVEPQQPAAVPAPAVTTPTPVEERPATVEAPPSSSGGSGRVNVKGYYRKDGTYVAPHTRSAPRRR